MNTDTVGSQISQLLYENRELRKKPNHIDIRELIEEIDNELYVEENVQRRWWLMYFRDGLLWRERDLKKGRIEHGFGEAVAAKSRLSL